MFGKEDNQFDFDEAESEISKSNKLINYAEQYENSLKDLFEDMGLKKKEEKKEEIPSFFEDSPVTPKFTAPEIPEPAIKEEHSQQNSYGAPQNPYGFSQQNSHGFPQQNSHGFPQQNQYGFPQQNPYSMPYPTNFGAGYPPQPPQWGPDMKKPDDDIVDDEIDDETAKLSLLDKVKDLSKTLERVEEDLSDIKLVNEESSLKEIQKAHKMLKLKIDRIRYADMSETIINTGLASLEGIFDGNREIWGKKITLKGLQARMQWKMKFIKPEITECVQSVFEGLPSVVRIGSEFAFMIMSHSRDASTTIKHDNISSDYDKISSEMNKY